GEPVFRRRRDHLWSVRHRPDLPDGTRRTLLRESRSAARGICCHSGEPTRRRSPMRPGDPMSAIRPSRIGRYLSALARRRIVHTSKVTSEDIGSCYRLLLERDPDLDGLRTYSAMIGRGDVHDLVTFFLGSPEFKSGRHFRTVLGQPDAADVVRVDLGTHVIYVLGNDAWIGRVISETKTYEPHVTSWISRFLEPGSTFVDVGASVGFHTLLAAR